MRRIVVALFLLWAAPLQAQLTQSQIQTTINADLLSCGNGCITADVLRFVLGQMNQATFQAQGSTPALGCGNANPNCLVPTAPAGTSTDQAASTAFINDVTNGIFGQPHTWVRLQTFAVPIVVGNGTPLSLSAGSPPITLSSQFIPPSARTTADPIVAIERHNTFTGGPSATSSPTLYLGTQTDFGSTVNSWGNGLLTEVLIASNAAATGQSYMEATRSFCAIAGTINNPASCWGTVSSASIGTGAGQTRYISLVAHEGQVAQSSGVDAPSPPTYNPSNFKYAISYLASCFGLNVCDWAYGINPYGTTGAQAGFTCPKEIVAGSTIKYACFFAANTAPYAIDISSGTWGTLAFKASGFTIDNAGVTAIGAAPRSFSEQVSIAGDAVLYPTSGATHGLRMVQPATSNIGTLSFIGAGSSFAGFQINWNLTPSTTNTLSLGLSALQWTNVFSAAYTVNGTAGASCTLTTVSHLTVVNGIVTLCN